MVALKARQAIHPRLPEGDRIYAIGDVHGRLDLLEQVAELILRDNAERPAARVTLILLGDLIDRGPASREIVDSCRTLSKRLDGFVVLKGNHEAMMVDALGGDVQALTMWRRHGGDAALRSWGVSAALIESGPVAELLQAARTRVSDDQLRWLDARPLVHRAGNCLFVHAGIRPGVALERQHPMDLLWIRGDFTRGEEALPYIVVHGHSASEAEPALRSSRFGIDTGAYRTGRLTALGLEGSDSWVISTSPEDAVRRSSEAGFAAHRPDAQRERFERIVDGLLARPEPSAIGTRRRSRNLRIGWAAGVAMAVALAASSPWLARQYRPVGVSVPTTAPIMRAHREVPNTAIPTAPDPVARRRPAAVRDVPAPEVERRVATVTTKDIRRRDDASKPDVDDAAEPAAVAARTVPDDPVRESLPPAREPARLIASAAPPPVPSVQDAPPPIVTLPPPDMSHPAEARRRVDAIDVIRQLRRQ